ncbi:hypothetical protein HN748_02290 [Candidatus Peregrinibacteria bacterium]|nr:hypothetical protein [Candidatus Peregrinibacteria bacterium]
MPLSRIDILRLIYLNMREANTPEDIIESLGRTNEVDGWEWHEGNIRVPFHLLETVRINADDKVDWKTYQTTRDVATVLWWIEGALDEAEGLMDGGLFARFKAVDVEAMKEDLRQGLPKELREYV